MLRVPSSHHTALTPVDLALPTACAIDLKDAVAQRPAQSILSGLLLVIGLGIGYASMAAASDDWDELFGPADSSTEPPPQAPAQAEQAPAKSDAPAQAAEPETAVLVLPDRAPEPVRKAPSGSAIEEIVVTATKREQSVRDLVGTIDAFTGDALIEKGATGLEEILKFSPGVTIATGTDGESAQISFRGILSEAGSTYFGRTFGLFYGDVSMINPTFRGAQPDFDPWDMATVEVLKGPQGTLFGGGALSGAVRFVPNQPNFEGFSGNFASSYMRMGYSDDSGFGQRLALNMPVSDTMAFRMAGGYETRPGYVDDLHREIDDINSSERTHGRILGRWAPSERLEINLQVMQRRFQLDDGNVADNDERPETHDRRVSDVTDSRVRIITADIDYDLGWASVRALLSQVDKSHFIFGDGTAALNLKDTPATAYQILDTETSQPSFELRLTSAQESQGGWLLGGWNYMMGLYLVRSDQQLEVFIDASDTTTVDGILASLTDGGAERPDTLYSYGGADAVEQALFFDLGRNLTDTLEISLGARWFKQESEAVMYDRGADGEIQRTEATPKDSGVSPKLGFIWRLRDNLSVVTSVARGFRYGGVNVLPATSDAPRTYDSDFLWNYEAGVRTDWLDNHLQIDLTAFYIDWTDLQIAQLTNPDELFVYVTNVGAARTQGAELALRASLPWQLKLQAGAAYTDARTAADFESDSGPVTSGTRLPASPYYSGFVSLSSDWQFGITSLTADVNLARQGSSKSDLHGSITLPGYSTLGLTLRSSWDSLRMAPELRLNVTNATNETEVAYARESRAAYRATFIQPRLVTLTLGLHF